MSQYTLNEIKQYNGQNGSRTWIVIHDIVYDVTEYLQEHPGGGELISDVAGRDCTKEYDDFGHSNDAKKTLKKFIIGELIEEDKRSNRKKKITKPDTEAIKKRRRFRFFFCA